MVKRIFQLFLISGIFIFNSSTTFATDQTISIYHPNIDSAVTTITPKPFQLETDFISYEQDIQQEVQKISRKYYQNMILDKLDENGNIIPGKPEVYVDKNKLVDDILSLAFTGGKVNIPFQTRTSGYEKEDAKNLTEVVLASYTTYYNKIKIGRSTNIELSAAAINNVIVGSGDIFSFNATVGPRELDFGYQEAPEIVNGKMVLGVGGGICQTSSTLFNAVDQLGVKIIERHHHSRDIGYVPKGRDATVSFGGLDYKFQNTLGIPFVIKTYAKYGVLTVVITTSKEFEQLLKNEANE